MDRRTFVKYGIASTAALAIEQHSAAMMGAAGQHQDLSVRSDELTWQIGSKNGRLASTSLENRLAGHTYAIEDARELTLTFDDSRARVDIPWWRCRFGPDDDSAAPEQEQGYREGYHHADFDDSKWTTCGNLCLYGVEPTDNLPRNQSRPGTVYNGYGWFRSEFTLPSERRDQPVVLSRAGYDQTDWKEYWVYVNGQEVGHRMSSGRWRTPGTYEIAVGTEVHNKLVYGGQRNTLAVRSRAYDRHFDDLSDEMLSRHIHDTVLCDQFVTAGRPYKVVDEFEIEKVEKPSEAGGKHLVVHLVNRPEAIRAAVHYEVEGSLRRKWAEIQNDAKDKKLLLDVEIDSFGLKGNGQFGGYGYPLTVDDEIFCAVENPSGLNRYNAGRVSLIHFPGKWLGPGEIWKSNSSIVGVAKSGDAHRQFLKYIAEHSPRKKKVLALYDPFGITAFTEGTAWALNDLQNLGTLDLLDNWQKKGIHFDYYIPDMSLDTTPDSDLKRFRLFGFPDGPKAMIDRVRELGMKFGQWFSVGAGFWSNGQNPVTAPCRIPGPKAPENYTYRHGNTVNDINLCVASEPYRTMLKDAAIFHIENNHVDLVKFDCGVYYCNSTTHAHLPGKYSTEAAIQSLIAMAEACRAAKPDVFVTWYWGAYSPFFALHGDVIFDIRLSMEACSTGDFPSLFFRDSVNQALDQGSQFARWVPPANHDSLGVWLANNWWGNYMETERWQESLLMDLARGNLLFPQIWSDLNNLEARDVDFLAYMQQLVKKNESVFLQERHTVGNPWKDEIYGYSYFEGDHGFVILNNMSFESRIAHLRFDQGLGFSSPPGASLSLQLHHPERAVLAAQGNTKFVSGQDVGIQLRPFEVAMIEVAPGAGSNSAAPARECISASTWHSKQLAGQTMQFPGELKILFADSASLEGQGFHPGFAAMQCQLPELSEQRHYLALVCRFQKEGKLWRRPQMSEVAQATADVDGRVIEFTRTPDFRQTSNNQWNPWLVFSAPLPRAFSGKNVRFGINTYLPEGVTCESAAWVVKQWWTSRMRPLPNYWM